MKKQEIINLLEKFITIESVSTDPKRRKEIIKAAAFLKKELEKIGCSVRILKKNNYPPLVFAVLPSCNDRFQDCKANKTIGIYGHYDIQPEEPVNEWQTPPFKLALKEGKFFGRGVADNKGHIIQNIVAIKELIETKKLKNNIFFIFEGEEESGDVSFEWYVNQLKEELSKVDVFYLTDTGMHNKNQPQIFYGLRGIIYFELKIKVGERDLHSGVYGNMVFNPINVLASLIGKIKDIKTGKILIPDFYRSLRKITEKEINLLKTTIKSEDEEKKEAQIYRLTTVNNLPPSLSTKILPSFDCHGITAGFTNEGQKTIIPKEAMVKFSFRLVEYQKPEEIEKLVGEFIKKNIPQGVKFELKTLSKSSPFYTDINNSYLTVTKKILEEEFGNECLLNCSGGSVPAAEILQRVLKKPIVLTGFTPPDDNIHAPNENFDEEIFFKGIETLVKIYSQ